MARAPTRWQQSASEGTRSRSRRAQQDVSGEARRAERLERNRAVVRGAVADARCELSNWADVGQSKCVSGLVPESNDGTSSASRRRR